MDIKAELETIKARLDALEAKGKKRGTRIPKNWAPSGDEWEYARNQGLTDGETRSAAADFRDYWETAPGSKGVKIEWHLVWHKWVRTTAERLGRAPRDTEAHPPPDQSEKVQEALRKLLPDATNGEMQLMLHEVKSWPAMDILKLARRGGMRHMTLETQFAKRWREISGRDVEWR